MSSYFVDTGYLIALANNRDQHHEVATAHWEEIRTTYANLYSTTYVFDEFVTICKVRGYHKLAVDSGRAFLDVIDFQHIDIETFEKAWQYFCAHDDKKYSFTDCVSFVVMANNGLDDALAFDAHFVQAGFAVYP